MNALDIRRPDPQDEDRGAGIGLAGSRIHPRSYRSTPTPKVTRYMCSEGHVIEATAALTTCVGCINGTPCTGTLKAVR